MQATSEEKLNCQTYDALGAWWAKKHSGGGFWREEMAAFSRLVPRGRLLEVGSGGGRDAKELTALGYDYLGVDISQTLLKVARKANPGLSFARQSVCHLALADQVFDGFWASAVLLHIPKRRVRTALSAIRRSVRAGGVGFISLKQGEGERVEERPTEVGRDRRFFAYYSSEEFDSILAEAGFEVVEIGVRPEGGTIWLCFLVKVPSDS